MPTVNVEGVGLMHVSCLKSSKCLLNSIKKPRHQLDVKMDTVDRPPAGGPGDQSRVGQCGCSQARTHLTPFKTASVSPRLPLLEALTSCLSRALFRFHQLCASRISTPKTPSKCTFLISSSPCRLSWVRKL